MAYQNVSLPSLQSFKKNADGKNISLCILSNSNIQAAITNYGARWVSMLVPDNRGIATDVVLGFDSIEGYLQATEKYYGATVGRYANRIAKGRFALEGKEYKLATNNPPNHLHGGIKGFHDVVWDVVDSDEKSIRFQYVSKDGEEGYPGKLSVTVDYTLTDENKMIVSFNAVTNKSTVINLTNHAYFNLNGQGNGSILNHLLKINAGYYTPIDETSIPYGTLETVGGTPFDFREGMRLGERIDRTHIQLANGSGYDHNFVLNDPGNMMQTAAEATGDISGIKMTVFTTEPGIQLYTGNFLNNENILKGGYTDGQREAFCLETQHYPDSPNQANFPSVVLSPGEEYKSVTAFQFSL